jgi:hypothetical protein
MADAQCKTRIAQVEPHVAPPNIYVGEAMALGKAPLFRRQASGVRRQAPWGRVQGD